MKILMLYIVPLPEVNAIALYNEASSLIQRRAYAYSSRMATATDI